MMDMAVSSPQRFEFKADVSPVSEAEALRDEAPALSSDRALARFEFESGRGNDGTKILMVEWSDEETDGAANMGDWEVSWEGKSTVVSAKDGTDGKLHRIYFLLAPGASIPRIVKLEQKGGMQMQTNPLPAIFPPELGVSATTQGRKGVLHTLWGKKRISVLQKEIELEMKNGEGVGLEMAVQEKEWIEENFGIGPKLVTEELSSPKTPGGGRLADKLKGLRLGTSMSDSRTSPEHDSKRSSNPLSPDTGDVAVSSFALFHGNTTRPARTVAHDPPIEIVSKQNDTWNNDRISSLDAIAIADRNLPSSTEDPEVEEGLFAVMMSPRSPEMKKSPFSFSAKDTVPWLKADE